MYGLLNQSSEDVPNLIWNFVWKLKVLEQIQNFIWKIYHNGIITNSYLNRLQLHSDACNLCGMSPKTILHALRDCTYPKRF